jgi:hypothetical protein
VRHNVASAAAPAGRGARLSGGEKAFKIAAKAGSPAKK